MNRPKILAIAATALLSFPACALDELIEKQVFSMPSYTTAGGRIIRTVKIGYETYGKPNAAKDNAILVPHFFSGNSHVAGRYRPDDKAPGYGDAITGPGLPLDTSKYFVIGVDSLCNLNTKDGITVTTGPASTDAGPAFSLSRLWFPGLALGGSDVGSHRGEIENRGARRAINVPVVAQDAPACVAWYGEGHARHAGGGDHA